MSHSPPDSTHDVPMTVWVGGFEPPVQNPNSLRQPTYISQYVWNVQLKPVRPFPVPESVVPFT